MGSYQYRPAPFIRTLSCQGKNAHFHWPVTDVDVIHDHCIDGYACRALINEHLGCGELENNEPKNIRSFEFIRPAPQEKLKEIIDTAKNPRGLIIADYSFPCAKIEELAKAYDWVVICDHHHCENEQLLKANGSLPSNVFHYFDVNKCGGDLVLDFLQDILGRHIPKPDYLKYVSQLDLGLNGSTEEEKGAYDALSSALGRLFSMDDKTQALLSLRTLNDYGFDNVIAYGKQFVDQDKQKARDALKNPDFIWFEGCKGADPCWIPIIDGDILDPFGGRALADMACEEASKYEAKMFVIVADKEDPLTGNLVRHFSLRAAEDGPDGALVAAQLGYRVVLDDNEDIVSGTGGGGHRRRSAFQCEREDEAVLHKRYSLEYIHDNPNGPEKSNIFDEFTEARYHMLVRVSDLKHWMRTREKAYYPAPPAVIPRPAAIEITMPLSSGPS